tara:strand:- start:342 stop:590 length:249 start_codon:yes stop_codon:yes gene_type:complete
MEFDLLKPSPVNEQRKHKLKRIVQRPNSTFIDIKCKACSKITHTFTHARSIIRCWNCKELLATPTGGKINIKDGNLVRKMIE